MTAILPDPPPSRPAADGPTVEVPFVTGGPLRQIGGRLLFAVGLLVVGTIVVYLGRDGYTDEVDGSISLLDAFYYSTVGLTTTGYGDITAVTPSARLVSAIAITPLRVAFLFVVIGTTVEIMVYRTREQWRIDRWRRRLRKHTVVIGFGTKGRGAVDILRASGVRLGQIVVVDPSREAVNEANARGIAGIVGDATRADVLRRAELPRAGQVLVTAYRDDTAVLATLTARQLNPDASIVVSARESENVALLRQSGADAVVTSSESVGRILGLSTVSPALGSVLEDLLTYGHGLEVAERPVLTREEGMSPRQMDDVAVGVVRDETVYRYFESAVSELRRGDRLIVIRSAEELPWAPRPGTDAEPNDSQDDTEPGEGRAT